MGEVVIEKVTLYACIVAICAVLITTGFFWLLMEIRGVLKKLDRFLYVEDEGEQARQNIREQLKNAFEQMLDHIERGER